MSLVLDGAQESRPERTATVDELKSFVDGEVFEVLEVEGNQWQAQSDAGRRYPLITVHFVSSPRVTNVMHIVLFVSLAFTGPGRRSRKAAEATSVSMAI